MQTFAEWCTMIWTTVMRSIKFHNNLVVVHPWSKLWAFFSSFLSFSRLPFWPWCLSIHKFLRAWLCFSCLTWSPWRLGLVSATPCRLQERSLWVGVASRGQGEPTDEGLTVVFCVVSFFGVLCVVAVWLWVSVSVFTMFSLGFVCSVDEISMVFRWKFCLWRSLCWLRVLERGVLVVCFEFFFFSVLGLRVIFLLMFLLCCLASWFGLWVVFLLWVWNFVCVVSGIRLLQNRCEVFRF